MDNQDFVKSFKQLKSLFIKLHTMFPPNPRDSGSLHEKRPSLPSYRGSSDCKIPVPGGISSAKIDIIMGQNEAKEFENILFGATLTLCIRQSYKLGKKSHQKFLQMSYRPTGDVLWSRKEKAGCFRERIWKKNEYFEVFYM